MALTHPFLSSSVAAANWNKNKIKRETGGQEETACKVSPKQYLVNTTSGGDVEEELGFRSLFGFLHFFGFDPIKRDFATQIVTAV